MASSWIAQVFKSKIAKRGGVVRRKMSSIKKNVGMDEFKAECKRRG